MKSALRALRWSPPWHRLVARLQWSSIYNLLLLFGTSAALIVLIAVHLDYYQVGSSLAQFRAGRPAPRDIIARQAIQWEEPEATARRRAEAAKQVEPVYSFDPQAKTSALATLDDLFVLLQAPTIVEADREMLERVNLPREAFDAARKLDQDTQTALHARAQEIIGNIMNRRIEQERSEGQAALWIDDALAAMRVDTPEHARVLAPFLRAALKPNWVIDQAKTAALRAKARESVPPSMRLVQPGEVVVRKGDPVTAAALKRLTDARLLVPMPLAYIIPLSALVLFAFIALGIYLRNYCPAVYANRRKLTLLALLIVPVLWANMTLGEGHELLVAMMVIPAANMAIAGLLGTPVAIVSIMLTSAMAGLTADRQFAVVLLTLGSSLAGVMAISAIWPARRAIPAVLSLVAIDLVLLASLETLGPGWKLSTIWTQLGTLGLWATAGGTGAVFIAVGAIYMLARPFGITTHYRLMELSNTNEPLLRRLMEEAPGTYHSSVMVSNMAEAAADAIGADALLARVGALYHDIGKLKRPGFFVENQAPLGLDNIHQRLSPKLSYLILASHVRDGYEIARQQQLPEEIGQFIREHHGTTLAAYFYHRAMNDNGGASPALEHEFRYPGPKPSSKEAAIIMLADSVQASVKAIKEPTPNRIEHMVNEIINSRLSDGQLEDCDLTLRDLRRISEVFIRMLAGLYSYTRIEYPDIKGGEGTRPRANLNPDTTSAANPSKVLAAGR
jgi:putative nucleotidyltransferase with HDIG domain